MSNPDADGTGTTLDGLIDPNDAGYIDVDDARRTLVVLSRYCDVLKRAGLSY